MSFPHLQKPDWFGEESHSPLMESSEHLQRTLIVGLGGTGGEVIKRLKRRLGKLGQPISSIRFLSLDTDIRTWLGSRQFPALEPRERVPLYFPNPENVLESPHLYPTIQHLFHMGRKVDLSILGEASGAGLMPVVGRTAFHLNATQVYAHMQRAMRDLQAIPPQAGSQPLSEEFRVYVLGSAAGGTGAGCFVEAAVLIRHLFRSYKYQIIGLLVLPESFVPALRGQQLDGQSRGNAYAVLKELQYLQDGPVHWSDPESYTFQFQLGSDLRTITLSERPFHILYTIDNQNQEGGLLRNLTDIYEMAAQQLSVEIGSPLGAKFASAQANDRAILGLAPCPETNRPANISSLATAALVIPTEKLLRYCAHRYLREVIHGLLLGNPCSQEEADEAALGWLTAAGLTGCGGQSLISRSLLAEKRDARERRGAEFALDLEAYSGDSITAFLAALTACDQHFAAQALPAIRIHVEKELERLQKEMEGRLRAWLEEGVAKRGLRGAVGLAQGLIGQLGSWARSLVDARAAYAALLANLKGQLERRSAALQETAGLWGALFGGRKERMRLQVRIQAEWMQQQIDGVAGTAMLRLAEALRVTAQQELRQMEILQAYWLRLEQSLGMEMGQEEWVREHQSGFALETHALRPEHYRLFYDRFCPGSPEVFVGKIAEGKSLMALAKMDYGQILSLAVRSARLLFVEQLLSLNVVEVMESLYSRAEIFALLDDLARRCQPFWTATPRGAHSFSDLFLVGSPGCQPEGSSTPVQAEPLLQEWVEQHHTGAGGILRSDPAYIALGSQNAIIFSRQTHGARFHYMRLMTEYSEHYRTLVQQPGYPVHFKSCLEALPELRPDDEKATESWALGVAYGMIALRTFGWVWAVELEQRHGEAAGGSSSSAVLRAGSLWDLAAEITKVDPFEIAPHSSRFLHATRSGACGQFAQRREAALAVERLVNLRLDQCGKQGMAAELARYLELVLSPRIRKGDEMESATLSREYQSIRRFLDRLNL